MKTPEVLKKLKQQAPGIRASLESLKNEALRMQNEEMNEQLHVAQLAVLANKINADAPLPPRYEMVDESDV